MIKRLIEQKYRIVIAEYPLTTWQGKHNLGTEGEEADSFTRSMRLDEIPPEYKHLKVIGRGNTSIILEKDPETAIMLTRDSMKKEWLHFGLKISKDFKILDVKAKNKLFKDFDVFAIEMPKLYKLSPQNRAKVNKELNYFEDALAILRMGEFSAKSNVYKILDYYEKDHKKESILYSLLEFLQNYEPTQWNWDLGKRQFAQDKKGNIVLVDPIVATDLVKRMIFDRENWDERESWRKAA
jgi:hypothetical protein